MKRIYLFLLLSFAVFAQTNLVRVPASTVGGSGAKCQLRGVAGTRTAAIDSINGVYNNPYFEFTVTTSGRYDLYYDSNGTTGGVSYSKQTDWSGTYGRWISGLTDIERSLSFQEIADTDNDGKVETAGLEDSVITSIKIKTGEVKGINVADSTLPLSKLTTAAYNFIGSGGTVTNNPDDLSLANKAGSTIGIKESYFVANDTTILKTLNRDSVGSFVNLRQLSSSNASGGGMFVYIDSTYAEGVKAFGASVVGKQWANLEYLQTKRINVKWAGAVGDSSDADTSAIRKAFAALEPGETLYFPKGKYVSTRKYPTVNGITIEGAGDSTVLSIDDIILSHVWNVTIKNMTIIRTGNTVEAIQIRQGSHDITLENLNIVITGTSAPINIGNTSDSLSCYNITIDRVRTSSAKGIRLRNSSVEQRKNNNIRFLNCDITVTAADDVGIEAWTDGVTIQGCTIINTPYNGGYSGLVMGTYGNFNYTNNTLIGWDAGIEIGNTLGRVRVTNNLVKSSREGISVSSNGAEDDIIIANNEVIFDTLFTGSFTEKYGIYVKGVSAVLTGNIIKGDTTQSDTIDYTAIYADTDIQSLTISGGAILNMDIGVQVSASASDNIELSATGIIFKNVNKPFRQSGAFPTYKIAGCIFNNTGSSSSNGYISFVSCSFFNDPSWRYYNKGFVQSLSNDTTVVVNIANRFVGVLNSAFQGDSDYPFTATGYGRPTLEITNDFWRVSNHTRWSAVDSALDGAVAEFPSIFEIPYNKAIRTWNTNLVFVKTFTGVNAYASAVPTTGAWAIGDIVYNTNKTAGYNMGWTCTSAGSPGTWMPFGQRGYRTNAGSPHGSVTSYFTGERLFDSSNSNWYRATGTGTTNWKQESN